MTVAIISGLGCRVWHGQAERGHVGGAAPATRRCCTGKLALTRGARAWALVAAVVALAASAPAALAQLTHVYAVGDNSREQLGNGEDTWSPRPSLIDGVTAVVIMAFGTQVVLSKRAHLPTSFVTLDHGTRLACM